MLYVDDFIGKKIIGHALAWLCCSSVLPLRGEQQATDNYPAKAYICQFALRMRKKL